MMCGRRGVGVLLVLLLLCTWQCADQSIIALCACLTMLALVAGMVASEFGQGEMEKPVLDEACITDSAEADVTAEDTDCPQHYHLHDMLCGQQGRTNSGVTTPFDTDVASGDYTFFHRELEDDHNSDPSSPHAHYFLDKRRNWELRFRCTFKKSINARDMRISVSPFERLPVGAIQVGLQRMVLKIAGPTLGSFYNSLGDDPVTCDGEAEHPGTSIAISETDQYIPHTFSAELPSLVDHKRFTRCGRLKVKDAAAYRKAMDALTFEAGETHTFGVWGPSRFFHLIKWCTVGLPFCHNLSLDALNGPPPLIFTVYVLNPDELKNGDMRHLESRMDLLIRVACWSSLFPPSPAWRRRLEQGSANSVTTSDADAVSSEYTDAEMQSCPDVDCCSSGIRELFRSCAASVKRSLPSSHVQRTDFKGISQR